MKNIVQASVELIATQTSLNCYTVRCTVCDFQRVGLNLIGVHDASKQHVRVAHNPKTIITYET